MNRRLPLAHGVFAIVDEDVYEWASRYRWACFGGQRGQYVARSEQRKGRGRTIYLHREVMNAPVGFQVDHVNGNTLDNRRANLRVVTKAQNMQNRQGEATSGTGIRNVYTRRSGYQVKLMLNRKNICIGTYQTIEEAESVATEARRRYFSHSPENSVTVTS